MAAEPFEGPPQVIDLTPQDIKELERERELLTRAIQEERRDMARQNFWYFLTKILFPHTWEEHYSVDFHKPLCERIQNLERGKDLWLIIPREHRKSFIITIAHTLWLIIRDPNIRILLVGAREETVKPFARLIRSAFVEGTPGFETFQQVFDDFIYKEGEGGRFLKQSFQFECKLKTRTTPDPTFRATYLGVTGAGWRCDVLKYDDAVERRNVSSPEMSAKTLSNIMDLLPLVDTTSKYRNITGAGTRWAYHDPYGKIIGEREEEGEALSDVVERLESRGSQVIVRHALEDPNTPCTHCPEHIMKIYPHGNPDMEKGEPISAPIHTRETLYSQYERYLSDPNLGEAMWWHQYMNVCMAPSLQKIKEEWFFEIHQPTFSSAKRRVLALDGAEKDFQRVGIGDYMVALFGEFDDNGRLCVVHGLRSNKDTKDQFIRKIISWCMGVNWWPTYIVKEKFGNDSFLTDIRTAFLAQSRPVFCHAETRGGAREAGNLKKFDWIISCLQGPMERGQVVWGSRCPRAIIERAKYETTNLGQVAHDDVADTLALFFVTAVRVKSVDKGPGKAFRWQPPSMGNYNTDGTRPVPEWEVIKDFKGQGTQFQHSPLEAALESKRVMTAFASVGQPNWEPPEQQRPPFTIGDYE